MEPGNYDECEGCQEACDKIARKDLAALPAAQPGVNILKELDALPMLTIVRDAHGHRAEKWVHGFKLVGAAGTYSVSLPARVLYRPEVPGLD
ncbi:hypothetical protein [Glutamicibacter arilaitensis]|uniref:hypothetical protein n=1 Tax=Glutamicibacter arilaitensis TaxID=256701 RepID=UPI00384D4118